jgi:hypothetical protein
VKLIGRSVDDVIVGKPILTFSDELTKEAVKRWFTKIEHMEEIYAAVEKAVSDGHIESVFKNLTDLQTVYSKYKTKEYERSRKV